MTQQASKNNKVWKKVGLAGLATGGVVGLGAVAAARYIVNKLTGWQPLASDEIYTFTPYETQVDYEEISFPTVNGRILRGWWLPRPGERKLVVVASGYRGKKEDMLGISSSMWRHGYNVMMFDYRGYGQHRLREEVITLGHRELQDMQAALRYAKSRVERPLLGILGGSMGAAISLVATARDKDIMAVWADSPFSSQAEIVAFAWRSATGLPERPVVNIAAKLFEARTGHRWDEFEPIKEIPKIAPRPIYLVHGTADKVVPVDCAYQLYAAISGSPKELWIEEGEGHCEVYFQHRAEYTGRVLKFFDSYLVEGSEVGGQAAEVKEQPTTPDKLNRNNGSNGRKRVTKL